jgi:hypothetical protein
VAAAAVLLAVAAPPFCFLKTLVNVILQEQYNMVVQHSDTACCSL